MKSELLPIVYLRGAPRFRGQAHGETLREVIAGKIVRWHDAIGQAYGEPAETFLPRFLAATDFAAAIERFTPDLAEEVAGIAEGAAISRETAFALQLMDEEWWFGQAAGPGHCSSLAIADGNGRATLVGQTMDLPRWHDGAQALLRHVEDDGSQTLVFTSAGMIGLMGVSSRGLGICVNTLAQLPVSGSGLPVAFAMRGALAAGGREEAAAFLEAADHASGQTYQLGDRKGIATLECSAAGTVRLDTRSGRSLHTNHPLQPSGPRQARAAHGEEDSRARLESLHADLDAGPASLAAVRAALSACRPGGVVSIAADPSADLTSPMTVGAVVYEIDDAVTLSVAAGPPSCEDWRQVRLDGADLPVELNSKTV